MTLIGPKPKDQPVFPTPWSVEGEAHIYDASRNAVLYISSDHATGEEDLALAELIVELINNHVKTKNLLVPPDEYEYYIQRFETGVVPNIYRIDAYGDVEIQYYNGSYFEAETDYTADRVRERFQAYPAHLVVNP